MVRVFGLLIAALALMAPANAALLTYDFNNNVNGVVDPTATGASSTPFTRTAGDNLTATSYQTTALSSGSSVNSFTFTAGALPATLSDVTIFGRRLGSGAISAALSYQIDSGPVVLVDTATPTGTNNNNVFGFLDGNGNPQPVVVAPSSTITFFVTTTWSSGSSVRYEMDNLVLNGTAVPEPASMAIFGLMGAGLAVRRFRRK